MTKEYLLSIFRKHASSYLHDLFSLSNDLFSFSLVEAESVFNKALEVEDVFKKADRNIKDVKYFIGDNYGRYDRGKQRIQVNVSLISPEDKLRPEAICVAIHEIYHSIFALKKSVFLNEGYIQLNTVRTMLQKGNRHLPISAGYFPHMVVTTILETALGKEQLRDFAKNEEMELHKAIDAVAGKVGYANGLFAKMAELQYLYAARRQLPENRANEAIESLAKNIINDIIVNLCSPQGKRLEGISRTGKNDYISEIKNKLQMIADVPYINEAAGNRVAFLKEMVAEVPRRIEKAIGQSEKERMEACNAINESWANKKKKYNNEIDLAFKREPEKQRIIFNLAKSGLYKTASSNYEIALDGNDGFVVSGGVFGENKRKFRAVLVDENNQLSFVNNKLKVHYCSSRADYTPPPSVRGKLPKAPVKPKVSDIPPSSVREKLPKSSVISKGEAVIDLSKEV